MRLILGLEPKILLSSFHAADLGHSRMYSWFLSLNGQRCTALKVLYVHESIVEEFNKRLKLVCYFGNPWDKSSFSPLPEKEKTEFDRC
jgi:glyceraldehyde-3-phosphate dehydrogenase (NADP+)